MVCRKGVGDMLLRQIKYFVDIIEHNNFTLAAEENGISQSAISQQMAALEAELGVKLLLREGRKFKLTDAGKYFCEKGKVLLENADALVAETRRIGSDDELKLNIGYLASYQGEELQNAILEFSRIYPEVVVTIFNGSHEQLYRALRDGRASIAMSDQRRAFSDEYENYLLAQAPAYADVAPTSPLAERAFLTVDELSSTPCILVAERSEEQAERAFYADTLGIGKDFLFAASRDEARLMVMSGRGYLLADGADPASRPPLIRKELRRSDGSLIVRTYCAFWQKRRTNYYIEEFASLLRKQFAK